MPCSHTCYAVTTTITIAAVLRNFDRGMRMAPGTAFQALDLVSLYSVVSVAWIGASAKVDGQYATEAGSAC